MRKLTILDAPSMAALERDCFSLPWSVEQCTKALCEKAFLAFGLFKETLLFAYISVYHIQDEMEILNLAVTKPLRQQGFGRFLLTTALQAARKMGIETVYLEVRCRNFAAIHLYEAVGFQRQGMRRQYYRDTNEDALIYQLQFADAQADVLTNNML